MSTRPRAAEAPTLGSGVGKVGRGKEEGGLGRSGRVGAKLRTGARGGEVTQVKRYSNAPRVVIGAAGGRGAGGGEG